MTVAALLIIACSLRTTINIIYYLKTKTGLKGFADALPLLTDRGRSVEAGAYLELCQMMILNNEAITQPSLAQHTSTAIHFSIYF